MDNLDARLGHSSTAVTEGFLLCEGHVAWSLLNFYTGDVLKCVFSLGLICVACLSKDFHEQSCRRECFGLL